MAISQNAIALGHAFGESTEKVEKRDFRAVGNGKLWLTPSCAHSLLRSFIRLHGVNHNQPFPTATSIHKIFTSFTIFIVFQCFRRRRVSKALIHCGLHRNMPKACPYVMTQFVCPSIVADINHRKPKQTKRTVPLVCFGLFALSDNLISEVLFFAEGEWFLSFWRCHRPRKRAVLGVWCG